MWEGSSPTSFNPENNHGGLNAGGLSSIEAVPRAVGYVENNATLLTDCVFALENTDVVVTYVLTWVNIYWHCVVFNTLINLNFSAY